MSSAMGKPKLGIWPWSHTCRAPPPQGRRLGRRYALGYELEAPGRAGSVEGELGLTSGIGAHGGVQYRVRRRGSGRAVAGWGRP